MEPDEVEREAEAIPYRVLHAIVIEEFKAQGQQNHPYVSERPL